MTKCGFQSLSAGFTWITCPLAIFSRLPQHIIQVLLNHHPFRELSYSLLHGPILFVFILLIILRNCLLYVFACSLPPPLVPPGL